MQSGLALQCQVAVGGHVFHPGDRLLMSTMCSSSVGGEVRVNGELEQRRGRQLISGDQVQMGVDSCEVSDSSQAGP